MNAKDDNSNVQEFADVREQLDLMALHIGRQKFPGRAWQGPPRRNWRIILPAMISTAAAIVMIVLLLNFSNAPATNTNIAVNDPQAISIEIIEQDLALLQILADDSSTDFEAIPDIDDLYWPFQPEEIDASYQSSS